MVMGPRHRARVCMALDAVDKWAQLNIADAAGVIARVDHYAPSLIQSARMNSGAHCAHDEVCLAKCDSKIAGSGVTDGHSGVGFKHHHGHGFAQNGAPANTTRAGLPDGTS